MKRGWQIWAGVVGMLWAGVCGGAPILIDHRNTDITQLTETQINRVKAKLHIAYGHTSHGSQLTEGMDGLVAFANGGGKGLALPQDIFAWNQGGTDGALDLHDYAMEGDVGYYPDWVSHTRAYLDDPAHARVNVIVWSWCGQMDDKYSAGTLESEYLEPMAALERRYPHVVFVYMTGHVDIWDDVANKAACQVIRNWCATGNRVLYDFNDIEHYNPDGTYYEFVNDDCAIFDGPAGTETGNWATSWQNSHTQGVDWYECGSQHSQPLNANQKAYAAWALWCKIAEKPILNVGPSRREVNAGEGTTTFQVVNRSGGSMRYRASETSSWLRITGGTTGTNRGTVTVAYGANPSTRARTGTVTVAASGTYGSPRRVKIVQAGRPRVDLVLRNLQVRRPSNPASRRFTACSFQIYNNGPALDEGTVVVQFFLSRDATFRNADDRRIGDTRFTGLSVPAGSTRTIRLGTTRLAQMVRQWTAGLTGSGYYYLYARVACATATETHPGNNRMHTASRFLYSPVARCAKTAERVAVEKGCAAWARNGDGDWDAAPELIDGDPATVWQGAGAGPWAVAVDLGGTTPLAGIEIEYAGEPWEAVNAMGTEDLLEWFDLMAITNPPVPCRAVFFDFQGDLRGRAPRIREIGVTDP